MELLTGFKTAGNRGFYRPSGHASAGEVVDMITGALRLARTAGLHDIMINISGMAGFESPGPAFRRWAVRRWASTVGGTAHIAMVARSEHICPDKTGLLVAAEEGLRAHVCLTEREAIAWLSAFAVPNPA